MIFTIIGYCICVGAALGLTAYCVMMLLYGGGDCGPLFGNWVHKGARPFFFACVGVAIVVWYFVITTCPFTLTIGTS